MDNIGFGKRAGAVLLDMVVFGIPFNIVQAMLFGPGAYDSRSPVYPTAFVFSVVVGFAYNVGMWAFADGATLGKKILKIKIVKLDGSPLTMGSALGRYVAYLIAAIPCGLGLLWVLWDEEHRGWHDKMADTKVISTEFSDQAITSANDPNEVICPNCKFEQWKGYTECQKCGAAFR